MKIKEQHKIGVMSERFAKNLVKFREGMALTQRDLAKRLKLSNTYVYLLEKNERVPSLDVIEKAAEVFKVPPHRMVSP